MSHPFHADLFHEILSFLQNPADLKNCLRVNKHWHHLLHQKATKYLRTPVMFYYLWSTDAHFQAKIKARILEMIIDLDFNRVLNAKLKIGVEVFRSLRWHVPNWQTNFLLVKYPQDVFTKIQNLLQIYFSIPADTNFAPLIKIIQGFVDSCLQNIEPLFLDFYRRSIFVPPSHLKPEKNIANLNCFEIINENRRRATFLLNQLLFLLYVFEKIKI